MSAKTSRIWRVLKVAMRIVLVLAVGMWLADRVVARYFNTPLPWITGGEIELEIRNELERPIEVLSVEADGWRVPIPLPDGETTTRIGPTTLGYGLPYWSYDHWPKRTITFWVRRYRFPLRVTYSDGDARDPETHTVYLNRAARGDCRYIVAVLPRYSSELRSETSNIVASECMSFFYD